MLHVQWIQRDGKIVESLLPPRGIVCPILRRSNRKYRNAGTQSPRWHSLPTRQLGHVYRRSMSCKWKLHSFKNLFITFSTLFARSLLRCTADTRNNFKLLKSLHYFQNLPYSLQPVGCDLEIGSLKTVDSCGVCGGDGKTCALPLYQWNENTNTTCSVKCGGGKLRWWNSL